MVLFTTATTIVIILTHVVACCLVGYGIFLSYTEIVSGAECDMTYSMREFLPIRIAQTTDNTTTYRLYQFFDHRDPRHRDLLRAKLRKKEDPILVGKEGCLNKYTTTAVLYIPGHGGSYQQSRSLGAHGIQLTEGRTNYQKEQQVKQALFQGNWTGSTATSLDNFVFEVYAVDFREEGTGLHGQFMKEQGNFVADAVRHLVSPQACHYTSLHIVAHSLGGYAARLALMEHADEFQPFVHSIITLGTPHAFPVFALDSSIYNVHKHLQRGIQFSNGKDLIMVSISGGLRDEMIPPESCEIKSSQNASSVTFLATSLMRPGTLEATVQPTLGMDHRAIVWCHNLLDQVRTALFVLTAPNDHSREPLPLAHLLKNWNVSEDYSYSPVVKDEHRTMKVRSEVISTSEHKE